MTAEDIRRNFIAGTPAQATESIERWSHAGAQRLHLLPVDPADVEHLEVLAALLG